MSLRLKARSKVLMLFLILFNLAYLFHLFCKRAPIIPNLPTARLLCLSVILICLYQFQCPSRSPRPQHHHSTSEMQSPDLAAPQITVQVGTRVLVNGKSGVVRFYGPTQFSPGQWVGVELDVPQGKNDGSVQGIRYFACEAISANGFYGLFVRPNTVKFGPSSRRVSTSSSISSSPRLSISPTKVSTWFMSRNLFLTVRLPRHLLKSALLVAVPALRLRSSYIP